jgi:hypothetical protein
MARFLSAVFTLARPGRSSARRRGVFSQFRIQSGNRFIELSERYRRTRQASLAAHLLQLTGMFHGVVRAEDGNRALQRVRSGGERRRILARE